MIHSSSWWRLETAGWAVDESDDATAFRPGDTPDDAALIVSAFRRNDEEPIGDAELRELSIKGPPAAVPRVAVQCGDFRGYQAAYDSDDRHWRMWWLASRCTHLYATFNCALPYAGQHDAVLDWMLSSLREVRDDAQTSCWSTDWQHLEDLPAWIDRRLRIRARHCDASHYLVGNPHTFRGRMSAWCVSLGQEISISKSDVIDPSPEAQIWIDGFLRGNEGPPPAVDDCTPDEVVERLEADWYERRQRFRETGVWTEPDQPNDRDGLKSG